MPLIGLHAEEALRLPVSEVVQRLQSIFPEAELDAVLRLDVRMAGVANREKDCAWLKTSKMVGVNVRTLGDFWKLIPYALTLPACYDAIHLLPVWEAGVAASLYGPASWNINPEFISKELQERYPMLDTPEKQLAAAVNVLHLLGKSVGIDVVPHTDRFSEMVLANPSLFEWLHRRDRELLDHSADLHLVAEDLIFTWLKKCGPAAGSLEPVKDGAAFFYQSPEEERLRLLFGERHDYAGRLRRRVELVDLFYQYGFETAPATMAPPYRGLDIDTRPEARHVDEAGRVWYDYRILKPEPMSRVFGPLTRYKLYEPKDNNRDWALDFSRPNIPAWDYVKAHFSAVQAQFNFDFMRGDMAHVQMRPDGVPRQPDAFYDIHAAIKTAVQRQAPGFASFAEGFLAEPNTMAYGDECDHLEASLADATLGNLHAMVVGTPEFVRTLRQYRDWLENRSLAPAFTIFTADLDDPRFDRYYLEGNEVRHFLGLFLTDMPAYTSLGFEYRDPHPKPAPNEHYTKLYVFYLSEGPKSTRGPYVWGQNRALHDRLLRQWKLADRLLPRLRGRRVSWVLPPNADGNQTLLAWTAGSDPAYLFVANLDLAQSVPAEKLPLLCSTGKLIFSTHFAELPPVQQGLAPGEGWVLEL